MARGCHYLNTFSDEEILLYSSAACISPVVCGARAALGTLAMMEDCERILVTPGMVELGEREYDLNRELGEFAADCCDAAILVGERQAPPIKEGLLKKGYPEDRIYVVKSLNEGVKIAYGLNAGRKRVILLENDLPDNY